MNIKKNTPSDASPIKTIAKGSTNTATVRSKTLFLMGWPIFFVQERSGLDGKPFKLIKLRSMKTTIGSDADRLTGFGKVLRATSIDELPSIINVLRGDVHCRPQTHAS